MHDNHEIHETHEIDLVPAEGRAGYYPWLLFIFLISVDDWEH